MSEEVIKKKSNAGRPEKPIDWEKVDELLMAGCTGTEIAPHFDIHPVNFYPRFEKKFNMKFTEYCGLKRSHGDSLLRQKQFEKALAGDNTLLIWLGKNRLGQRENDLNIQSAALDELLKQNQAFINHVKENQDSARKNAESSNSSDCIS